MVHIDKNDDKVGLYFALDSHDYKNLPIEKVRVYATDVYWVDREEVWMCMSEIPTDSYLIKAQDYLFLVFEAKRLKETHNTQGI